MTGIKDYDQYFLSYTGVGLPLKLVGAIGAEEIENRNTFFGAKFDADGRLTLIHKRVYGEIELSHQYHYDSQSQLEWAEIHSIDDEGRRLYFDSDGKLIREQDI